VAAAMNGSRWYNEYSSMSFTMTISDIRLEQRAVDDTPDFRHIHASKLHRFGAESASRVVPRDWGLRPVWGPSDGQCNASARSPAFCFIASDPSLSTFGGDFAEFSSAADSLDNRSGQPQTRTRFGVFQRALQVSAA
jgi:hypothetical protein